MKHRSFVSTIALAAVFALPTVAGAQGVSSQCPAGARTTLGAPDAAMAAQDVCQKAIDLFQYLAPQLGVAVAGGNATIGVGGTVGGLGHIYLSGRANLVSSDIPQIDQVTPSVTGARSDRYPTRSQLIGLPEADASIGIFKGLPLGITNVGGVDLLLSAAYLPSFSSGSVDIRVPHGSVKLGAGVRLGIVQESVLMPGVSVTYLRRGLPTVDVVARAGSDTLRVDGINETTDSWRLVVSKNLFILGVAAGVGRDTYDSKATVSGYVAPRALGGTLVSPAGSAGPVALTQSLDRTTYFVDGSLNFMLLHLIGEIGHTTANSIATYNTFEGSPAGAARTYGAIGVRFGI